MTKLVLDAKKGSKILFSSATTTVWPIHHSMCPDFKQIGSGWYNNSLTCMSMFASVIFICQIRFL